MRRLLLLVLCVATVAGCRPKKLAGERVGQYRIEGTLDTNECGGGHPAPAALTFFAELRVEPGSSYGYWKLPDGPLVSGSLDEGTFRFEQRGNVTGVPSDPARGIVGCVLERAEVVSGELRGVASDAGQWDAGQWDAGQSDAGGADAGTSAALRGGTTITITPIAGGDCTPLLLPYGGAFPVLPCRLRYDLVGEQLDEPLF